MHYFRTYTARISAHDTQKVRKITKNISYTQENHQKTCVIAFFVVFLQPILIKL